MPLDYQRDPEVIYQTSFAAVAKSVDLTALPKDMRAVALRIAHSYGDAAALDDLRWSDGAAAAGRAALASGASILADARMVDDGIIRRALPAENPVMCTLSMGSVHGLAARGRTTRSAAAVELWEPWLAGAVVVIGNEGLAAGWSQPALIVGMPVGYVGATEAKDALIDTEPAPYIALAGRRGGSAAAAATVNALAREPDVDA